MVRCKFVCNSLTKMKEMYGSQRVLFNYSFCAVTSGSEENKQFFAYTPSGKFEVQSVNSELFEVGSEYYFDISPAMPAPAPLN